MNTGHYNATVIGLGAMGSATLYHLAQRGWRVLGLERFTPGHKRGSSHGDSRIIRETYFEHPLYVPLVQRAHELWRELEHNSGSSLMTITGGIRIGTLEGVVVPGTLRSVEEHRLPHEILTPAAVRERFPDLGSGRSWVGGSRSASDVHSLSSRSSRRRGVASRTRRYG